MKPSCGCAVVREALPANTKRKGGLRIDRAALRKVLGGELLEALEAKASGRPSVNAAATWRFFTTAVYQSGDLPVLATRECLQNSLDAIRTRRPKVAGRFEVRWDPARRSLSWTDSGRGMDAETILTKFLTIGESGKADAAGSDEAAGGFGVAKAVILGASSTFHWTVRTRDNLAVSRGAGSDVEVFDAEWFDGTEITVHDVAASFDSRWDRARQAWVPIVDRLHDVLAANDLPQLEIVLDGVAVAPMFSRRGGSRIASGSWGAGTEATVKAYRRPPGDRQGAYYVRLGGLFQFRVPAQRGNLRVDVVIDLTTTVRPGHQGYPLNAARDAFQDQARWTFADLVDEVERENESSGRNEDDEVFDPDADDEEGRAGAAEIGDLAARAFADASFRRALADAAGGIVDFYAEREKYAGKEEPVASAAPPGTKACPAEDAPTRTLPPGIAAAAVPVEPDLAPTPPEAARRLRGVLEVVDRVKPGTFSQDARSAIDAAEAGRAVNGWGVKAVWTAMTNAAEAALEPGGGGLVQAAAVMSAGTALVDVISPPWAAELDKPVKRNPFGSLAGLRISRKRYDRRRAARFRKTYDRWIPHLTAWDATLRLVAAEAGIRRRFKPGFVLDDEVLGLTTSSGSGTVIYIHPDRLAQVVKAHRERPLAIAAYLHGVACHELTHADGRMGEGHSEEFVVAREDLGAATGHLLPAIAVLVANVLQLPVRPTEDQRRIAALERQLEAARRRSGKRTDKRVADLERRLDEATRALAEARASSSDVGRQCDRCGRAGRVVDAAIGALRAALPAGVSADDVDHFAERHRQQLVSIVERILDRRGAGQPTLATS